MASNCKDIQVVTIEDTPSSQEEEYAPGPSNRKRKEAPEIRIAENEKKRRSNDSLQTSRVSRKDYEDLFKRVQTLEGVVTNTDAHISSKRDQYCTREDFNEIVKRVERIEGRTAAIENVLINLKAVFQGVDFPKPGESKRGPESLDAPARKTDAPKTSQEPSALLNSSIPLKNNQQHSIYVQESLTGKTQAPAIKKSTPNLNNNIITVISNTSPQGNLLNSRGLAHKTSSSSKPNPARRSSQQNIPDATPKKASLESRRSLQQNIPDATQKKASLESRRIFQQNIPDTNQKNSSLVSMADALPSRSSFTITPVVPQKSSQVIPLPLPPGSIQVPVLGSATFPNTKRDSSSANTTPKEKPGPANMQPTSNEITAQLPSILSEPNDSSNWGGENEELLDNMLPLGVPIKQELYDACIDEKTPENDQLRINIQKEDKTYLAYTVGEARKIRNQEKFFASFGWSSRVNDKIRILNYYSEMKSQFGKKQTVSQDVKQQAGIIAAVFAVEDLKRNSNETGPLRITIVTGCKKLISSMENIHAIYPFKELCTCEQFKCGHQGRWTTNDSFAQIYHDDLPRLVLASQNVHIDWRDFYPLEKTTMLKEWKTELLQSMRNKQ